MNQLDKVRNYYNSTWREYRLLWTGRADLAMHFGYYDETIKNHSDSLLKLNSVMAAYANIQKNDRVLDAGCGFGGSSIWLAKNRGCYVTGLTIVPFQLKKAQKYAEKYKVHDKVTYLLKDYCHTGLPTDSFDVVWGIESIVHAESKTQFVKEASRLLKPGGRLIIAEYMLREDPKLSVKEKKFLKPWLDGWEMPHLLAASEYKNLCVTHGFTKIEQHDITKNVLPSFNRLKKWSAVFNVTFIKVCMWFGLLDERSLGNRIGAEVGIHAMEKGLTKYIIFVAKK